MKSDGKQHQSVIFKNFKSTTFLQMYMEHVPINIRNPLMAEIEWQGLLRGEFKRLKHILSVKEKTLK